MYILRGVLPELAREGAELHHGNDERIERARNDHKVPEWVSEARWKASMEDVDRVQALGPFERRPCEPLLIDAMSQLF